MTYNTVDVRKRVGMVDEHGCICADHSECCGELAFALDEVDRLTRDNELLSATLQSARVYYESGDPSKALADIVRRINEIEVKRD